MNDPIKSETPVGSDPLFGIWNPLETAPKDRAILIAWGTATRGAMGYDIVKWKRDDLFESENSDDVIPACGYSIITWMDLPPLPNASGDARRDSPLNPH